MHYLVRLPSAVGLGDFKSDWGAIAGSTMHAYMMLDGMSIQRTKAKFSGVLTGRHMRPHSLYTY